MAGMTPRLLLINGSLRGANGNTGALLANVQHSAAPNWQFDTLTLAEYSGSVEALAARLQAADALLIGSGVYWGSWGSPLQRFLEVMSGYELSPCFLGKPAGAVISADSVGGLDVAQRLLGSFNLLGCLVPPLATVVVSRAGCAATRADAAGNADVWQPEDLEVVVHNLRLALAFRQIDWERWPVRQLERIEGAYPSHGTLANGLTRFV